MNVTRDPRSITVFHKPQGPRRPFISFLHTVCTHISIFLVRTYSSFYSLQKFNQTSELSFVPPDGNFILMDYRLSPTALTAVRTSAVTSSSQSQIQYIPIILKPTIELTEKGGTILFVITPRSTAQLRGQPLEQVVISLYLGSSAIGATCSVSFSGGGQGSGGIRDREREDKAAGGWAWEPKDQVCFISNKSNKSVIMVLILGC